MATKKTAKKQDKQSSDSIKILKAEAFRVNLIGTHAAKITSIHINLTIEGTHKRAWLTNYSGQRQASIVKAEIIPVNTKEYIKSSQNVYYTEYLKGKISEIKNIEIYNDGRMLKSISVKTVK
jgi:hypothetical protein